MNFNQSPVLDPVEQRQSGRLIAWFLRIFVISASLLVFLILGWRGIPWSVAGLASLLLFRYRIWKTITGYLVCLMIYGIIIYPALQGPRGAIVSMSVCERRHSDIHNAIYKYNSENGHLPPPFSLDENGQPLHSWRVLLLPQLGYNELYQQIDLTKPWDDPVNVKFHNKMPKEYACNHEAYYSFWGIRNFSETSIVVFTGENALWRAKEPFSIRQIAEKRKTTPTPLVLFAEDRRWKTNWMNPECPTISGNYRGESDHFFILAKSFHGHRLLISQSCFGFNPEDDEVWPQFRFSLPE